MFVREMAIVLATTKTQLLPSPTPHPRSDYMMQQTQKAIVPALAVAFIFCSCIFSSCEKCELENDYTIHFINDSTIVRLTGTQWIGYTSYEVKDAVISNMRGSFKEKNRVKITEGPADFLFIIDSISTESDSWEEEVLDPCYGDHNWIYQQLHPQETITYTLNSACIYVYGRFIDTLRGTTTAWNPICLSSQYLQQPTDTTGECHSYEIQEEGSAGYVLREVGQQTGNSVCQWVQSVIEGH